MNPRFKSPLTQGSVLGIVVAIVLGTAATQLIYANVEAGIAEEKIPLPVQVTTFKPADAYQRTANFVGVVRAGSDSALGFEVAGTIDSMPAREGSRVALGDTLATLDLDRRQAQLRAAEAELERIDADLELAKLQKARIADLENRGLASKQNYDEVRLNETALSAARMAVEAKRDSARLEVEKSHLIAPYSGVIAERLVQEGAVVNAGTPVLRLIANSGFEAHVGIPGELASDLQRGGTYSLKASSQKIDGVLRAVRTDVDPATLTVGAVFELGENAVVNAGESIVLKIEETVPSRGGWLPMSALIEGDRGLWSVMVVERRDGHFIGVREAVEVIYSRDNRVFVRGTLADGAQVVATGLQRLSPGTPIDPLPANEVN